MVSFQENSKNSGEIDFSKEEVDKSIDRIKECKEYTEFRKRAEAIKERITTHGETSASILFCIGKK